MDNHQRKPSIWTTKINQGCKIKRLKKVAPVKICPVSGPELCQKPNSSHWVKQSRKMRLLKGFRPVRWDTQGYQSNEFWVAHRLKGFWEGKCRTYLDFSADWLPGGLLPYFGQGSESEEQGNPKMAWIDLAFGDWPTASADFWEEL